MFPILFRIPLPHMPLKLWWALVAVALIAALYAALAVRRGERITAIALGVFGALVGGAAYYWRAVSYEAPNLPIYSYGVMLGFSLVIGWYLTLTLADRDGLPKETMANCYVITAVAAIVGSRILYVLTNMNEFEDEHGAFVLKKVFELRTGGLVAYGGFLGGFLGSWGYLATKKIRLMPWADVAVPSLASGLLVTRIGCYLFGCDYGRPLSATAPLWLKKLGTFPHWATGTLSEGEGSPAWYAQSRSVNLSADLKAEIMKTNHSLPVHPTQIYESLVGLALLGLLLWQRKHVKFRGQIFFLFVFAYGFLRFLLEILRDDAERGKFGPELSEHVYVPMCLLLFAIAFVFGVSLGIKNLRARAAARVIAFVPPIVAYLMLKPAAFGDRVAVQLSTSQWIGLITALLASFFYAQFWQDARKRPAFAMSLGEGAAVEKDEEKEEATEEEEPEKAEAGDAKKVKKKGKKPAPATAEAKPAAAEAEDDEEEDEEDEKAKNKDAPVGPAVKPIPEPST
jgi:phosphatidylglycerol:prolipoprotein diacylglycerol transferase